MFCTAEQDLHAQGQTAPLAAVVLVKTAGPKGSVFSSQPLALSLVTPLGTSLTKPVMLSVDTGTPTGFDYRTCTAQGCVSGGPVSPGLLAMLRSGKTGHLQLQKLQGGTITINFDLSGLAGAIGAIDAAADHKAPG